jgi:poly [ADP-ribose] polymerase
VLNIFKLKRKEEQGPFARASKVGNIKLLWHASRVENFLGLLSRGILTPMTLKLAARRRGGEVSKRTDFGFLGAGLYFNDSSHASLRYATSTSAQPNQRLLMLAVSVACGKVADFTEVQPFFTTPPAGCNSCHGVSRASLAANATSDFENEEYVVYDAAQQKLEYLVEFRHV